MTGQCSQAETGRSDFRRDTPQLRSTHTSRDNPFVAIVEDADTAWEALSQALEEYPPPCTGRALFTADSITVEQQELCESICARCRVSPQCDAYATASKPRMGFWAGHRHTQAGKQPAGPRRTGGRPKPDAGPAP